MTRKVEKQNGEEQLAKVVLRPRDDELGDSFPNDWIEAAILFVIGAGIFGSIVALATIIGHRAAA